MVAQHIGRAWNGMTRATAILLALTATYVVHGGLSPFVPPVHARAAGFVHGVLIAAAIYAWCKAEADSRGAIAPGHSALWAGVFPPLGVPIYFYRTRPATRATLGTLKAFGLLLALTFVDAVSAEVVSVLCR